MVSSSKQQRWALVTGADRGLGLALVKGLLTQGYHVWAGQYGQECSELQELETAYGKQLRPLPLDISDADSVRQAIGVIAEETERLELLVNNGAILGDMTCTVEDELDFNEMEQVYRVNTLGALRMSNGLIDLILKSTDKLIVNISSEAGSVGTSKRTTMFAYCMSKAALNMQSQLTYNQISTHGGKVLVVHPGHVQSFMQGKLDTKGKLTPDESARDILSLITKRLGPDWIGDELALIDHQGEILPW